VKKRVVITDHAFIDTAFEESVALEHGADFAIFDCKTPGETKQAVKDADVVFVNFAPITKIVLESMKPGSTVIRYGIGYDNVDVASASALHINVANVPDYGVETVADHAAASLLSLCRRLPEYNKLIQENGWARPGDVGRLRGWADSVGAS
jgi:D-3-phosphoglycerate dehydrogenase / 2-oxoglutarate reductase